jgi:hypothetical protein
MDPVRSRHLHALRARSGRAAASAKTRRTRGSRYKGESGELFARLAFQQLWGLLPVPTKLDGVHGTDLLYILDRRDLPAELDPFCGRGPLSLLMVEVKSSVGLMKLRNWTSLLPGRGARRQMGPAWRAAEATRLRAHGGAVARILRVAGDPIPAMAVFDPTVGSECLAMARINHWATREITPRLILLNAQRTPGFSAMVRGVWPHPHEVVPGDPPFSSADTVRKQHVGAPVRERFPTTASLAHSIDVLPAEKAVHRKSIGTLGPTRPIRRELGPPSRSSQDFFECKEQLLNLPHG